MKVRQLRVVKAVASITILAMILLAAAMTAENQETYAASKKITRRAYDRVMKYKNTAYCAGCAGIYKVKLKNGKPVKITHIMKEQACYGVYAFPGAMRKKGKYIYYIEKTNGASSYLKRVGIRSHKDKILAHFATEYAISGKKIYYTEDDDYSVSHKVMKLSGKGKKKTSVKVKMNTMNSNVSGYSVKYKKKGKYVVDYLKTPKGTYKLGKVKNEGI